jgi:hypothetical protein
MRRACWPRRASRWRCPICAATGAPRASADTARGVSEVLRDLQGGPGPSGLPAPDRAQGARRPGTRGDLVARLSRSSIPASSPALGPPRAAVGAALRAAQAERAVARVPQGPHRPRRAASERDPSALSRSPAAVRGLEERPARARHDHRARRGASDRVRALVRERRMGRAALSGLDRSRQRGRRSAPRARAQPSKRGSGRSAPPRGRPARSPATKPTRE